MAQATKQQFTRTDVENAVRATMPLIKQLLAAREHAKRERERVDAIQRRVLAEGHYTMVDLASMREHTIDQTKPVRDSGERLLDPRESYLLTDESAARYHARLDEIHLAEGFARAAEECCPALVAEHEVIKLEYAVIDAAEPHTGFRPPFPLGWRDRYLAILINACKEHSTWNRRSNGPSCTPRA